MKKGYKAKKSSATNSKLSLSHKEFVERAIKTLREPPYKGIHVVFSNFNSAFRQYYSEDPRPIVDKMIAEGFLVSRPSKGGVIIMLASESDQKTDNSPSAALAKILTQSN